MNTLIAKAIEKLREAQRETEKQFAEAISLLGEVDASLISGDHDNASDMLQAASDVAADLGVEIDDLFDALGLDDGV